MSRILRAAVALVIAAGCAAGPPASPGSLPSSPGATATLRPSTAPTASAPSSASATARPTEAAVAGAERVPPSGEIAPGRYFVPAGPWTPATFSFTMPAGWIAENGGQTISKNPNVEGREVGFSVSIVDRLFGDPCGPDETIEVGPTADDLTAALRELPGPDVGAPAAVTIGDRPGLLLELTVPADVDTDACDPPIGLQIWLDKSGTKYFVAGHDITSRVYTVDVDGGRFVVVAHVRPTSAPADVAELDAIMESIRFER